MMTMPTGWTMATLADLGQWSSGGTPSRKNNAYFGGEIPWVLTGDLDDGPIQGVSNSITTAGLKGSSAKVFPVNTLLVAMYGATIGKLGTLRIEAATNQACAALLPSSANKQSLPYAHYYLLSQRENLRKAAKGGAQPNISQTVLKEFTIPLAPKDEQLRIVEKIETLFTQLDQGEASLRAVRTLLTRYRQSVLKAAVTGQLTADWRAQNTRLSPSTIQGRLGDIATIQSGYAFKSADFRKHGVPLIRISNLTGYSVQVDDKTVFLPSSYKSKYEKFLVRRGDILIAMSGATTGKMGVFELEQEALLNQRVGRFIPKQGAAIDVNFLKFVVLGLREDILAEAYGGAQPNISPTKLAGIPIQFPNTIQEQIEISSRISEMFSRCDVVERLCSFEINRSAALRQSILKDAFTGRLVPQDPNDEPASALLARIRAERDAATKPAARGRGKARSANTVSQHTRGAR